MIEPARRAARTAMLSMGCIRGAYSTAMQRIRIVLCRPSHPGNIGAAARAMKTMGLSDLRLVAPEKFPAPEAQWLATNAQDVLQNSKVHANLTDALARMVDAGAGRARRCSARRRTRRGCGVRVRQRAGRPDQRGNARLPVS